MCEAAAFDELHGKVEPAIVHAYFVNGDDIRMFKARGRFGFPTEDAQELIQETWLLYLEKRRDVHTPKSWLSGTIANLCRQEIQRRIRERAATSPSPSSKSNATTTTSWPSTRPSPNSTNAPACSAPPSASNNAPTTKSAPPPPSPSGPWGRCI